MVKRSAKIENPATAKSLSDLANVGPATLGDFAVLGITSVEQLARQDPLALYERLCKRTGARHDPCCIDVFLATVHEARGGKPKPWWRFTTQRKRILAASAPPRPKRSKARKSRHAATRVR